MLTRGGRRRLALAILLLFGAPAASAPLLSDVLPPAGGSGTVLNVVGAGLVDPDGETPLCRRVYRLPPTVTRCVQGQQADPLLCGGDRVGRVVTPATVASRGVSPPGGPPLDVLACRAPTLSAGFSAVAVALNGRDFFSDGLVFEYGAPP